MADIRKGGYSSTAPTIHLLAYMTTMTLRQAGRWGPRVLPSKQNKWVEPLSLIGWKKYWFFWRACLRRILCVKILNRYFVLEIAHVQCYKGSWRLQDVHGLLIVCLPGVCLHRRFLDTAPLWPWTENAFGIVSMPLFVFWLETSQRRCKVFQMVL